MDKVDFTSTDNLVLLCVNSVWRVCLRMRICLEFHCFSMTSQLAPIRRWINEETGNKIHISFSCYNMISNPQVLLNLTSGPLTSPPANSHNLSLLFTIILIYQTNIQFVLVPDLLLCPRRVISRPNCVAECFVDSETCSPSLSTTSAPASVYCPSPHPFLTRAILANSSSQSSFSTA